MSSGTKELLGVEEGEGWVASGGVEVKGKGVMETYFLEV